MKNNSSKSRFTKITAKVIVMLLAVVLSLSVLPALSADILPTAQAAEEYVVQTGTTKDAINDQLASYPQGTVVNMKLTATVDLTDLSTSTFSAGITGITIPAGITVNLFMNGNSIVFSRASDGAYRLPYFYGIVNKGTLNVYSGSSATATSSTAAISIVNVRTGMTCNEERAASYVCLEAIHNEGTLSVNSKVAITVNAHTEYDEVSGSGASLNTKYTEQVTDTAAAITNTDNAICVVNGATMNVTAFSYPWFRTSEGSASYGVNSTAAAYGIYGGNITVTNGTSIAAKATAQANRETNTGSGDDDGRCKVTSLSYGIASKGKVSVLGADVTANSYIWDDRAFTDGSASANIYSGGIYTLTGNAPTLPDVNITVNTSSFTNDRDDFAGTLRYREGTVVSSSVIPASPTDMVDSNKSFNPGYQAWPSEEVSAGVFYDESGNSYSTNIATSLGSHPTSIARGALDGKNRVHVVYRYWVDNNRSAIDTSIVGEDGNVGYSYKPLTDGTGVVNSLVNLSGVTSQTNLTKTADAAIKYVSGAESCNSYYWGLVDIAYVTTNNWFSDFNVTSTANRGSAFKTFSAQGASDGAAPAVNGPVYIFVDYARIDPSSIKASVGTSNVATTTYTGYPTKASDIGLKIIDSIMETDYTNEYNVDFAASDLIPITYSYTGRNEAGVTETSESGQLPTNAGTYEVTLHVAESTTYDKDPKHNKNRYGLDYTFTLIIEQSSILRGNLPGSVTLTYGQKLNEVLLLNTFAANGIAEDKNITGNFSFTNAADGSSYKNVGEKQIVSVTWTPTYASTATAKNYKATNFNVEYTVNKAPLTIRPNAAAVIYGNTEFDTPYSVTITGLVGNDTGDSTKAAIANALSYMILNGDSYIPYVAGEVPVGSYFIRATFTDVPAVLSNYEYSYVYGAGNNDEGVLRVSQRAITVEAVAKDRAYAPENFNVDVTFTITDGRFGVDDVRILAAAGALSDNSAGTKEVSGITKQSVADLVTGGAGSNYYVADVIYKTGTTLLVTISKGIPTVTTPVVEEMFYQRARTLNDIEFTGYTSSVEGSWQWVDASINPSVNVAAYKAQFVPVDQNNYEIKTVDIAIKVKATPVIISYAGSVSYGDNIPNITAYTYKADLDPTFTIDAVTTSGNITPHTTYVKGSPVVEGGYPVEISAPNFIDVNGNYTFTTTDGVITVNPRLITFQVEDATATYGDNFVPSASTVNVSYDESLLVGTDTIEDVTSNGDAPTFEYSTDFRYIDNYQVGSYYIKATPNFVTSPNYTVTVEQGTLKVTKAQLVIKAEDITLEYGSPIPSDIENAFTVEGAKRNETAAEVVSSGSIKVDTTYQKNSPVNTDGYPITVDVTNAVFNNYTVTVQHGVITVIKATPKVVTLPTASIIHGQTLGEAVFAGGAVENDVAGKYLYNAASTTPAYRAEAYTIYTATFIPTDSVNYNSVTGLYVALTVNKKPVSGALAVAGIPMVGQTLTVDVAGLDPDEIGVYTLTWYDANNTQVGTGAELTLTDAHKLQTLTVKAVANAPYTGEVVCVTTTIAPSLTNVETILSAEKFDTYFELTGLSAYLGEATYTYNAQPHYVEFQRDIASLSSSSVGNVTVKYNGSTTAPTTVGYYTVTIDIATPSDVDLTQVQFVDGVSMVGDKVVYSPVANYKIGTLVITQAPYYVNVEVLDKVYDGTGTADAKVTEQYGACELTGGGYDDVSFDEESAVYYFASAEVGTDIDVFVNNAVLKGKAAENYELLISMSNDAKADITKRTLKVKVVPVEREYEENNYYVDLSFEPVANSLASGDDGFVYVDEALVQGAIDNYRAGIRNVTVSGAVLTGSKAGNYELELTNLEGLTVEILKATPFYPIPMTDVLYYDSARPLNAVSLGDSRWAWDSEVANEVPGAGVHTYKAIYNPDDANNYATVEYDVEVEILRTTVTITAANFTVTYGDIEPTYYYSVSGLTGADTIQNSVDGYVLMNCSYAAGSDVGQYDIVLTGAFESDNYDFIYKNGKVTVNKRAAYVEAIAENREYMPGNLNVNVSFSDITNLYGSDGANDVFLEGTFPITGTIENENAGIKNVKYTMPVLAGAKSGNYELRLLNPTLSVEILKAKIPGVILPQTGTVGYGQKLSTTVFTSSYEGSDYGVFSMENPTMTPTSVGTFSDVYKVVFTPFNTQNYATVTQYITLTVEPSVLNVAIDFTGTAQVGKSLYVIVNNIPTDAAQYLYFEWYRVDSPDADPRDGYKVASGTDAYTLLESDGGKYILCTVTTIDGAPYNCYAECVTDTSIEEEVLTFWQRLVNWFYRLISNITQIFGRIM